MARKSPDYAIIQSQLPSCVAVARGTLDWQNRLKLISDFISSRRQGLSPETIHFYKSYLTRSFSVIDLLITCRDITDFLNSLNCSGGGKHAYYRALRAFYKWLYSPKSGYKLNPQDNPIMLVDSPKRENRIMPSLNEDVVNDLVYKVETLRDKCIIRLFFDSGMRLKELTNIRRDDINWDNLTITIIGKGNKQRKAPFTQETATMLKQYLGDNHATGNIWEINQNGIDTMIRRLSKETGIKFSCHSFRRGFACNLHRKGLSTLDIMYLGGWSDLSMVLRYTKSITFEDCLEHYKRVSD